MGFNFVIVANMLCFSLEDGSGVEGLLIMGNAKPGGKLLAVGYPVRGTTLCMFQWVRHTEDDNWEEYFEGDTGAEYVVTADDVDHLISVRCIPVDENGQQVLCKHPQFCNK
ncbi:hypothetical protein Hanom_Chr04g00301071 [Helianthus anomalus]